MDDFSAPDSECNSFGLPNYSINYIEPYKRNYNRKSKQKNKINEIRSP